MLIDSPIEATINEFFASGEIAIQTANNNLNFHITRGQGEKIIDANEFMKNNDLPYLSDSDLEILPYLIQWNWIINPREDNIPFDGQIWLLVDENSMSASEFAALFSVKSQFATVVGTQTGRVSPAMTHEFALPNTGIIFRFDTGLVVDDLGRSIDEFGVVPDIIIDRDADALDLVIEIIKSYR